MDASFLPILVMSVGLLLMFALSVPIYISFLFCNLIAVMLMMGPAGSVLFVNSISSTSTSLTLVPLPAFILIHFRSSKHLESMIIRLALIYLRKKELLPQFAPE